jgi:flavodoxin/Pyruvate/2-oxoacid:ferredoxin oxidoreductase delta subunit
MLKSLVVYFSQGGTTTRVAKSIEGGLQAAGYRSHLHNIRDGPPPDPHGYDLIGIGFPVYYYRPPFNIIDYMNSLPNLSGLPTFIFLLHGTYRFDAGNHARLILARKGAREVGCFHCYGADFFVGYLKQGYLFSSEHPTAYELSQAESFGYEVAAHAIGKAYTRLKEDHSPSIIYRIERFFVNRWLVKHFYSRTFAVNKKNCNMCGVCITLCPVGNIVKGKDGYPVWGSNCLLCLTCEMKCPKDTITSAVDWLLFRPFIRHNMRQAYLDPSIDYTRVNHGCGETRIL